ncbi:hypothetical protein F5Y08DRAFT_336212 [Xylaria arbuscula]|nr:hypothetical protein F5Y08DRAFT_336212 [Xylaria arbuscula]
MVRDASTAFENDQSVLTTLCGSVVTASIFSIANLMCHMLADLAAHPDVLEEHRAKSFRAVDTDILTWGAGRAACPGRLIADVAAKVFLIQMLDEYDLALVDGKPLEPSVLHEFIYFNPESKILMRRRGDSVGIQF